MTAVEESIIQLINAQLKEQLGGEYNKFRTYIDILNRTNKNNSDDIIKLKSDIGAYSDANEKIKDFEQKFVKVSTFEAFLVKFNENQSTFGKQITGKITELENANKSFVQQTNSKVTELENANKGIMQYCNKLDEVTKDIPQKIFNFDSKNGEFSRRIADLENKIAYMGQNYQKLEKADSTNLQIISSLDSKNKELYQKNTDLETKIEKIRQNYQKLENEYYSISQKIAALESKNDELSKKISEKETKSNLSQNTLRTSSRNEFEQTDKVIDSFNNWASYPSSNLPGEFAYVTGDFRIRTNQELTEAREETKWIINRRGTKTYLLPNPNSFNQMTNLDLYEMDLNMLKEKGKNKIKIINPCEISSSGWIEFKGKLQILS